MPTGFRKDLAVLDPGDFPGLAEWLARHDGQVFRLKSIRGEAFFQSLGAEDDARRTPINITSKSPGELRLISNFAHTPFTLDGLDYASIEGFWQGLKFPEEERRRALAALVGSAAKDAGYYAPKADAILYRDQLLRVGTWEHWQLMERASMAKFEQNRAALEVLLSTGERPLTHRVKPDSRTIPGVILADIWMRCRAELRARAS